MNFNYYVVFMKKFILLVSFLVSSSFSYAMVPQIEDRDVVLSSSQKQKLRKIPLECTDPAADLRLNPTKGEVLWFEKKKEITIPGYPKPFTINGDIEITLSPMAYLGDCLSVQLGLHDYNLRHMNDFDEKALVLSSKYPIGELSQESFVLAFDHLLPKIGFEQAGDLLNAVEVNAYQQGARRAYVMVSTEGYPMRPLSPAYHERMQWIKSLKTHHYTQSGAAYNLDNNNYVQHFYKELNPSQSQEVRFVKWDFEWISDENDPKDLSGYFGIFVREEGAVKGGVFGRLNLKAAIPHSTIGVIWVDDQFRGRGFGTKLMNFALEHSKKQGASITELDTIDFQAPEFYKKIGFEEILRMPNLIKDKTGKLNNSYVLRKSL